MSWMKGELFGRFLTYRRKSAEGSTMRLKLPDRQRSESSPTSPEDLVFENCLGNTQYCWASPPFPRDKLRLVVFRESDLAERRLLFDSNSVRPRNISENSSDGSVESPGSRCGSPPSPRVPITPDGKFELHKRECDIQLVGEMVFGAVAMAYKGEQLKLHENKNSDGGELMMTKVWSWTRAKMSFSHAVINENGALNDSSDSDSQYSTVESQDGLVPRKTSRPIPVEVPERLIKTPPTSLSSADSPLRRPTRSMSHHEVGTGPLQISLSPSSPSIGSPTLSHRIRHLMTLRPQYRRSCSDTGVEDASRRRGQLGLAVIFRLDELNPVLPFKQASDQFRQFLLTHVHLIEMELKRLQKSVTVACESRKLFFNLIHKAWTKFCSTILTLYSSPRLTHPAWLTLTNGSNSKVADELSEKFVNLFSLLIKNYDIKTTNFFISSLLTASLMHHLTWVGSVAPSRDPRVSSFRRFQDRWLPKKNTEESNCDHWPLYDPYWAQFTDVKSALGYPVKRAQIVVIGEDSVLVVRLLFLLSYFVRCSHLHLDLPTSRTELRPETEDASDPLPPASSSPKSQPKPVPPRRSKIVHEDGVQRELRTRSGSLIGGRRTRKTTIPNIPRRASVVKIGSRFEVTSVSKSLSMPSDLTEENVEKMRKVSIGAIKTSADINDNHLTTVRAPRPQCPSKKTSLDSGYQGSESNFESGKLEESTRQAIRSVDSGIGEPEALILMEERRVPTMVLEESSTSSTLSDCPSAQELKLFQRVFKDLEVTEVEVHSEARAAVPSMEMDCPLRCLGRSMLAGYLPNFNGHFVLSGVRWRPDIYGTISEELRVFSDLENPSDALMTSPLSPNAPEPQAVCIVANTHDWTVKVLDDRSLKDNVVLPAQSVIGMVEKLSAMQELGTSADFCLAFVEDCLTSLYGRSCSFRAAVDADESSIIDVGRIVECIDCDYSDVPLLMAIASLYSPDLLASLTATS